MKILAIETSCDETAVAVVKTDGKNSDASFRVLSDITFTQEIHKDWGGVVPNLAKREHAKNLVPILKKALGESLLLEKGNTKVDEKKLREILSREKDLCDLLIPFLSETKKPDINAIAVTHGPGLEPALWVGINFAKVLSLAWDIPVIPVDHMEGHIFSVLIDKEKKSANLRNIKFPAVSLLISGGHTELILIRNWLDYEVLGSTRDDACGEAFDKVARLLGLPYPGGPEISRLAKNAEKRENPISFTPPMIDSGDYDFSFSGLKTAVLYKTKELGEPSSTQNAQIALSFEKAVTEVLLAKTKKATDEYNAETIIVGGGVSANSRIRDTFSKEFGDRLLLPEKGLSTDNALMIAIAGFFHHKDAVTYSKNKIAACGNLVLK